MAFAGKWMKLENIMLSEIGQAQKTKGQMFSLISGWRYIEGWGWQGEEKNEGTLDGIEKNGVGGSGEKKDSRMRQIALPYEYVWLHEWCEYTLFTTIEMKSCTPFVYNESKFVCKNKKYFN